MGLVQKFLKEVGITEAALALTTGATALALTLGASGASAQTKAKPTPVDTTTISQTINRPDTTTKQTYNKISSPKAANENEGRNPDYIYATNGYDLENKARDYAMHSKNKALVISIMKVVGSNTKEQYSAEFMAGRLQTLVNKTFHIPVKFVITEIPGGVSTQFGLYVDRELREANSATIRNVLDEKGGIVDYFKDHYPQFVLKNSEPASANSQNSPNP